MTCGSRISFRINKVYLPLSYLRAVLTVDDKGKLNIADTAQESDRKVDEYHDVGAQTV